MMSLTVLPDPEQESMVMRAISVATLAHRKQKRWDGSDYIHHPLAVARMVQDCGGTPVQVIAAILHDVVEDTYLTLEDILEEFGKKVAEVVDALSQRKDEGETYNAYRTRCLQTELAILVKRSDTIHNLSTLGLTHTMCARYIQTLQECYEAAKKFKREEVAV